MKRILLMLMISVTARAQLMDIPFPSWLPIPATFDINEAYFQFIDQTIYLGANATGCPLNSGSVCDYYPGKGGMSDTNPCTAIFKDRDGTKRIDVIVTHGVDFDWTSRPCYAWTTVPKPIKYIRFRSDTPLPTRTVCSHDIGDVGQVNAGQRNHKCNGTQLGFPAAQSDMPVDTASNSGYTSDAAYNDLASMWSAHSANAAPPNPSGNGKAGNGMVIQPGNAHCATGTYVVGPPASCTSGGIFDYAASRIIFEDAHFYSTLTTLSAIVDIMRWTPQEWQDANPPPFLSPVTYLGAASDHIGLNKVFLEGNADDDGYSPNANCRLVQMDVAYGWISYSYGDACTANGGDAQLIGATLAVGPVIYLHNWFEGDSETVWAGGAVPSVSDLVTSGMWVLGNRVTANMRQCPTPVAPVFDGRPVGAQPINKTIAIGSASCSANTLTLSFNNLTSAGGAASSSIGAGSWIYITNMDTAGVAITPGWYTGSNTGATNPTTETVTGLSCTNGTNTLAGKIYGYVFTAGHIAGDPAFQNPVNKNRVELKEATGAILDGDIIENSCADGQTGNLMLMNVRANSGKAYGPGGQNLYIANVGIRNTIFRHGRNNFQIAARSAGVTWNSFPITNASCNALGTTATITATGASAIFNSQSDSYVVGANTSVMLAATGWYVTTKTSGMGSAIQYTKDGTTGTAICTPNANLASGGTLWGAVGSNGSGPAKPMRSVAIENILEYDVGDRTVYSGDGTSANEIAVGPDANIYGGTVTMHNTGVALTSYAEFTAQTVNVCPAMSQSPLNTGANLDLVCPVVLQMTAGDLVYLRGCTDSNFNSTLVGNAKGPPAIYVSPDQKSLRYLPAAYTSSIPADGATTTCPGATPDALTPNSGLYNHQSIPWPFELNHMTAVGVNGNKFTGGGPGIPQFTKQFTFTNSLQLQPGAAEATPSGEPGWTTAPISSTGIACGSHSGYWADTGSPPAVIGGMRWCFDTGNVKLQGLAFSSLVPTVYPANNSYPSWDGLGNPTAQPTTWTSTSMSNPANVGCANGASVDGNGNPVCIGLKGAYNTNGVQPLYPLNLTDWTQYALNPASRYSAGHALAASDGQDNGAIIPLILQAQQRNSITFTVAPISPAVVIFAVK